MSENATTGTPCACHCSTAPITFDWLESIGFRRDGIGAAKDDWRFFSTPEGQPPGNWQIRWGLTVINRHKRFDTQGDIVDLWQLLGVPWSP